MKTWPAVSCAVVLFLFPACRKNETPENTVQTETVQKDVAAFRLREIVTVNGREYERLEEEELGTCVTVDEGVDGNSALVNVRSFLQGESHHASIETARDKLNLCTDIATADIAIVGHGVAGKIYVGGIDRFIPEKTIGSTNESHWAPLIAEPKLKPGTGRLSLLSCVTGSGDRGAEVLNQLRRATNRPVRALNGVAYFFPNGILLQKGTEWNEATLSLAAVKKSRVKPVHEPFTTPETVIVGKTPLKTRDVIGLRVKYFAMDGGGTIPQTPDQLRRFLRLIDLAHPFEPPGEPLLPETARITLLTRDGSPRTLIIYGDVLARDADQMTRFYDIASDPPDAIGKWTMFNMR